METGKPLCWLCTKANVIIRGIIRLQASLTLCSSGVVRHTCDLLTQLMVISLSERFYKEAGFSLLTWFFCILSYVEPPLIETLLPSDSQL